MLEVIEQEIGFFALIGLIIVFFLFLLVFGFATFFRDFSSELRLLNREIARTKGEERRYYIRRRRRLWLSLLPFIKY